MRPATASQRHPPPRPPLGDSTSWITNQQSTPVRKSQKLQSSAHIPSNDSLLANGNLQGLTALPSEKGSEFDKKTLSSYDIGKERDQRRNSQVSATSTNASTGAKPRKRHIGPWLLGATLGKGANGRVRKARHALTGQEAAVKIVSRKSAVEHRSKSVIAMDRLFSNPQSAFEKARVPFGIEREIVIMKLIEHPNIIKLFDVWENRGEMYLVLELVEGGELFHHVVENDYLPEVEAVRIFRQLISGLAHCHRFRLCHRDLKPENILLDRDGNVKIVDFGMASMQPWGKQLDTSCGSPHYASPEIAQGMKYEGDKADIWSAGVVLYVMLVGSTPFGSGCDTGDGEEGRTGLRQILEEVIAGKLTFPSDISEDAQEFIVGLLQPNPGDRMTIEEMWNHPFLAKYESYAKHSYNARTWIGGPQPELTEAECGPVIKDREMIDMDIVDNLCTLWHTDDRQSILKSLLSEERNYEQIFYRRLLRSREEQEENFQGTGIEISTSDYHHVGKRRVLKRSGTRATMPGAGQKRTRSQFSIVSGHPQRSVQQTARAASEASTNQSYDPFRASYKFIEAGAGSAKITVLRGSSGASKNSRFRSTGNSICHPALTRLQDDAASWMTSSSPPPLPRDATGRIRELRHKGLNYGPSRYSLSSSLISKASSRGSRRSISYKRPVSFQHKRSTRNLPSRPNAPSPANMQERYLRDRISSSPQIRSLEPQKSSDTLKPQPIRSRKEGPARIIPSDLASKEKRLSAYLKDEARQVSQELGKFCDDAFNKAGKCTNASAPGEEAPEPGSIHRKPGQFATPPPRKSSAGKAQPSNSFIPRDIDCERPLPEPPITESLASRKLRELAKTRDNMVQSAAILPPGTLNEAIRSIDRLIAQTCEEVANWSDRRVASAPEARQNEDFALSPVKEEETPGPIGRDKVGGIGHRYVSEPLKASVNKLQSPAKGLTWNSHDDNYRRINYPDAMPAPLTIRKKASGSSMNAQSQSNVTKEPPRAFGGYESYTYDKPAAIPHFKGYNNCENGLEPIEEDEKEIKDPTKRSSRDGKLKSWFRKSAASGKSSDSDRGPTPPAKEVEPVEDTRPLRAPCLNSRIVLDEKPKESAEEEHNKNKHDQRSKFLDFFSKRLARQQKLSHMAVLDEGDGVSVTASSNTSHIAFHAAANPSGPNVANLKNGKRAIYLFARAITQHPQHWLARFLHVKPAKQVMAFQVSKAKAMKEVRGILRDWKRYGMRDIMVDKYTGRLWATVDESNDLRIKPVSLAVGFFTVVQRSSRKASLCVARFSQEQGAKSSFEKVCTTMKGVLRGRSLLVTEKKKAREMRRCLARWEREKIN